nr:hypothetical protein [Tanacetum cinerariifolium]
LAIAKDGRCFVDTSKVTTNNTLLSTTGLTTAGTMAAAIICLADNQKFNFSKHKKMHVISSRTKKIFANMRRIGAGFSRKKQKPKRKQRQEAEVSHDELEDVDHVPTPSNDLLPSGEDSYTLNELMVFCTSLQEHVFDLQEAKDAQRVKSPLEKDSLGAHEDASKQGRMIEEIDQDDEIALDVKTQGRTNEMFGVDDLFGDEVVTTVTNKVSVAPTTDVTKDEITMA